MRDANQAILLGAGASYEFGMPLVWELTERLKSDHKTFIETNLSINLPFFKDWGKIAPQMLLDLINDPNVHYEAIIGAFEIESIRNRPNSAFELARKHLVDITARYLTNAPHVGLPFLAHALKLTTGILKIFNEDRPTDFYTLNHDVMLEDILDFNKIPHKSGYNEDLVTGERYFNGAHFPHQLCTLTEEEIHDRCFDFLTEGRGANIFKIHGSLDTFLYNSRKDLVQFKPSNNATLSHLTKVKELGRENSDLELKTKVRSIGMLTLLDSTGKEHFFDRSLITGAIKFEKKKSSSDASHTFYKEFKNNINYYDSILCIGYSFGDHHINSEISKWLALEANRSLTIVDPYRDAPPPFALHLSRQIKLIKKTFLEHINTKEITDQDHEKTLFMHQQEREFYRKASSKAVGL